MTSKIEAIEELLCLARYLVNRIEDMNVKSDNAIPCMRKAANAVNKARHQLTAAKGWEIEKETEYKHKTFGS